MASVTNMILKSVVPVAIHMKDYIICSQKLQLHIVCGNNMRNVLTLCKIRNMEFASKSIHEQLVLFINNVSYVHNIISFCRIYNTDDFKVVVASYYDFLRNASEWLSHRATDVNFQFLFLI